MVHNFVSYESSLIRSEPPPSKDPKVRCIGGTRWRDFHPETWVLPNRAAEFFLSQPCEPEKDTLWIVKIPDQAQGVGLYLVNDVGNLRREYLTAEQDPCPRDSPEDADREASTKQRVVQRYIHPPLLLGGTKKFDIRVYMLIASVDPLLVYYLTGHTCRCIEDYDPADFENKFRHISNGHIQKHHPMYKALKNDINQEFTSIQEHLDKSGKGGPNWVNEAMVPRVKEIMIWSVNSVKHKLAPITGSFGLFGSDFIIGDDLNVWLVEHNWWPGFGDDTPILMKQSHARARDLIFLMLEVRDRQIRNETFKDVHHGTGYELLIDESQNPPYYFATDKCS